MALLRKSLDLAFDRRLENDACIRVRNKMSFGSEAPDQESVVRGIAAVDCKIQWYQRTLALIAALQYVLCMHAPDWIAPKVNVQAPRDLSIIKQML